VISLHRERKTESKEKSAAAIRHLMADRLDDFSEISSRAVLHISIYSVNL